MALICLILALVLFLIAASGKVTTSINLTAAGLFFLVLAELVPMLR